MPTVEQQTLIAAEFSSAQLHLKCFISRLFRCYRTAKNLLVYAQNYYYLYYNRFILSYVVSQDSCLTKNNALHYVKRISKLRRISLEDRDKRWYKRKRFLVTTKCKYSVGFAIGNRLVKRSISNIKKAMLQNVSMKI